MTDSNLVRFSMVKEAVRNTTPASPAMQIMRTTGITLTDANQTVQSDEIRSDRLTGPDILVGRSASDGFNFEFSATHFDDLLVATMLSTRQRIAYQFNAGVADSAITAVTDSSDTFTVAAGGAAFKTGHIIRTEGFSNGNNNGVFRVASSTATTVVVATATLTDEAAPPGTAKMQVVGFQGASGDITATASGLASTALDFTTLGLAVGQLIKVGDASNALYNFAAPANTGYARITAIAANALTLNNLPTGWGVDAGTGKTIRVFTADYVRVGTSLDGNTFTAETAHLGQAVPSYFVDKGLAVGQISFNAPARDKVTGSVSFVRGGGTTPASTSPISGATYLAPPVDPIFNTSSNVSRIAENGVVLGSPNYATSLSISINNNLRELPAIGNIEAVGIGKGSCQVTGNLTLYFGSLDLYNRARDLTDTSAIVVFEKNNKAYGFQFPKLQLSAPRPNAGGINTDVTVDATFNSSADSVTGTNFQIDFFTYVN